jgi:hypothetical protein
MESGRKPGEEEGQEVLSYIFSTQDNDNRARRISSYTHICFFTFSLFFGFVCVWCGCGRGGPTIASSEGNSEGVFFHRLDSEYSERASERVSK